VQVNLGGGIDGIQLQTEQFKRVSIHLLNGRQMVAPAAVAAENKR
jgi:hypothetical protein